jgi:hypothetical protein
METIDANKKPIGNTAIGLLWMFCRCLQNHAANRCRFLHLNMCRNNLGGKGESLHVVPDLDRLISLFMRENNKTAQDFSCAVFSG